MANLQNDPYSQVIADLERKRSEIDKTIESLKALQSFHLGQAISHAQGGQRPPLVGGAKDSGASPGEFTGMNMGEVAKIVLQRAGKPMGNQEIMDAMADGGMVSSADNPLNTIGAIVNRRAKTVGDIVSVGRGVWALKGWIEKNDDAHEEGREAVRQDWKEHGLLD